MSAPPPTAVKMPFQLSPSKERAMSAKAKAQQSLIELQREIFQAINRRPPETDGELQEWLFSPEGQAATAFQPLSATRWGEGRS